MEILLPFRPKENELCDSQEATATFRQEFSPNSTFSLSSYSVPKPPTPTSSPKIRRRNLSTSSNEASTVRRCLDLHSSGEDNFKDSELEQADSNTVNSTNMLSTAAEVINLSPSPTLPVSPTVTRVLVPQRQSTAPAVQVPPRSIEETNDSGTCNRKGKSVIVRRTRSLCEDLIQKLNSKEGKNHEGQIPINISYKQNSSACNSYEQFENGVTQATTLLRVNNINCHKRSGSDGNENTRCESPRKVQSDSSYENLTDRDNSNQSGISVGIGRQTAPADKLIATDFLTSLAAVGSRQSFGRQRPASFRSNVKVLPDWNRRLLNSREKANSSENLPSAAADVLTKKRPEPVGNVEPFSGSVLSSSIEQLDSPASTIIPLSGSALAAAAAAATVANSRPGFVILSKRPSTDSDDGSESSETAVGRQLGLPPRSRPGSIKKMTTSNGKLSPSCSGGIPASQPIVIDRRGGSARENCLAIETTLDSDDILVNSDDDGSDGDKDSAGNKIKSSRSSSLEMLHQADNPTVPVIMHPSARLKDRLPSCGSPPKQVTFNPQPHVKTFEDDSLTNGAANSSRKHHHYHHRRSNRTKIYDGGDRGASEIPFSNYTSNSRNVQKLNGMEDSCSGQSISGNTLILIHERHMAQMTLLMKKEVELLEEVRVGKHTIVDYRSMLTELLSMKAMVVQKMQDLLKKPDVPEG